MPKYREEFLALNGYKHYKDDVSILVSALSLSKAELTDHQLYELAKAVTTYLTAASEDAATPIKQFAIPRIFSRPTTRKDFVDRSDEKILKFVSCADWENYYSKGSFRLGTIDFYRGSDNTKIQDGNEGLSFVSIGKRERLLTACIEVGANIGIFCGTHDGNISVSTMKDRFGSVLLEIEARPFAARIADALGAAAFHVFDVVYSDAKIFYADVDISRIIEVLMKTPNQLDPHAFNEASFDLLTSIGLLPSVFCKPAANYAIEMERRIAFVFSSDLKNTYIDLKDPTLLKFVKVRDQSRDFENLSVLSKPS